MPASDRSQPQRADLDEPSPMHDLPSGVEFGTAVHAVFERVDPTAADLPAALRHACAVTLRKVQPHDDRRCAGQRAASGLPNATRTPRRRITALLTFHGVTGWPSSASSTRWPAATRRTPKSPWAWWVRCCAATSPHPTSLVSYPDLLDDQALSTPGATRLSDRQHRCRAPDPDHGGPAALPRCGLQDELAGRPRWRSPEARLTTCRRGWQRP